MIPAIIGKSSPYLYSSHPRSIGNFFVELNLHSVNPVGDEVLTWRLCTERFIWADVMTHRWSRNASSSRAIPYKFMKKWTLSDIAVPIHVGLNKKGMQSGGEIENPELFIEEIKDLCLIMYGKSDYLVDKYNVHKEIINRYTEPWGWINSVHSMSRKQLMNFFTLRISPYAHPNMQRLAVNMARIYRASRPQKLEAGSWHVPMLFPNESDLALNDQIILSVARSAWTSYNTVDGRTGTLQEATKRHNDCVILKHVTPAEHQFEARDDHDRNGGPVGGFNQYRHMIENESSGEFDFSILDTVYKDRDYVLPS